MTDERELGCICQGCGRRYTMDFNIGPHEWSRIQPESKPPSGGLLCGRCITDRLELLKEATVYFIYTRDPDRVSRDDPERSVHAIIPWWAAQVIKDRLERASNGKWADAQEAWEALQEIKMALGEDHD